MNRWNTRNRINKRDILALKSSMERNYELLQSLDKKLNSTDKRINVKLKQILEKCKDSEAGYVNLEILLKALMVDSLLKEIGNVDGTRD